MDGAMHCTRYLHVCPSASTLQEKAAGATGQHQYRDIGRAATGAGNRAGDGGQDFANAQVVRLIQERGRFAGDSRAWAEAAREDAQVFDRWKTGCAEIRAATREARSFFRKPARQTVREIHRAKDTRWGGGPHIRRPTLSQERKRKRKSACFVRNDRSRSCAIGGASLATAFHAERKSRFLASLGMTDCDRWNVGFHRVWCVGLGCSMRRGTWSAMRMP